MTSTVLPIPPAGKIDDDAFNFDELKLVEKPDSALNSSSLPQTLEGCVGYLTSLPLKPPNVDQKNPQTIAKMVNILTSPSAAASFANLDGISGTEAPGRREHGDNMHEGKPAPIYDYQTSDVMRQQLSEAQKRSSHVGAPGVFGHVVLPGCISLYKKDGKTYAVTEGRWWLMSPKATWLSGCKNISLDQDIISPSNSKVMIIRVLKGEIGLVREEGVERLLDVGTHVYNSGTVTLVGKKEYAAGNYFRHGRYHYVRVPRGKFAKVWVEVVSNGVKSVVPRLLAEGEHFVDSALFMYAGLVDVSEAYIDHGSVHLISVPKGNVAKVFHENRPRLLGAGDHIVESTQFEFKGFESIISNSCIVHGTITVLRVTLGTVALAWKDNEPVFIDEPGLYEFDSPDFRFVEFKNADERLIELGAKKIVLVHTGQVGVTYDQGMLKILKNGRHLINSSTHVFHSFLSTQQKSIRLVTLSANEKISRMSTRSTGRGSHLAGEQGYTTFTDDSDLTVCETKDLVKVGLRADVFYSIEDPEKCINKIDTDELEDLVRETAVATLTNIVRSTALNEIAQSKQVSAGSDDAATAATPPLPVDGNPPPSAPMFFDKAHDEFLSKLHDDFMERYGVDIANIRIESFKIMDVALADSISKHALTTAQIENEMANLEGKSLISTTEERTAAEIKNISAEADSSALKTATDGENQRKIEAAQAEAEALKIEARAKAEAESQAIMMKAKAEAEAIRLKAAAEAQRAELLSKTTLGQQESLLGIYSSMVINSNKGVEKIVYLDPSVNRESPFALGSLQNLNQDLHSLTQMGIAASETSKVESSTKEPIVAAGQ